MLRLDVMLRHTQLMNETSDIVEYSLSLKNKLSGFHLQLLELRVVLLTQKGLELLATSFLVSDNFLQLDKLLFRLLSQIISLDHSSSQHLNRCIVHMLRKVRLPVL